MRFAYLIMAHNNPEQLKILLHLLDYSENEIYLHIDKKNTDILINDITQYVRCASLHIYKKYKVYHADYSQTVCQTFLLEEACKTYHDYYHLISNADLPLKSNDKIVRFFEENNGKEFIHFESRDYCEKDVCKYFFFLYSLICSTHGIVRNLLSSIENKSIGIQKKMGVHRKFYCGANWYSITHSLATDFCKHKKEMLHRVRWTKSSDELIMQTFVRDVSNENYSLYAETTSAFDYHSLNRAIDWHRGDPYIWKTQDYDELINSPSIYGRKFDITIDERIVEDIANYVRGNEPKSFEG